MKVDVEKIVRENIDKTIHMSLATVSGDTPWVCEVHFAYDTELNLYWRSLKSRRHSEEIAENPKVAGNIIDKYGLGDDVTGVYFEGTAELLEGGPEQDKAAKCLSQRLGMEEWDIVTEAVNDDGYQFYKLTVKNWYIFGKFGKKHGEKHKLEWGV